MAFGLGSSSLVGAQKISGTGLHYRLFKLIICPFVLYYRCMLQVQVDYLMNAGRGFPLNCDRDMPCAHAQRESPQRI